MSSYSKHNIILVRYPFSDLSNVKVRPTIIVSSPHQSKDIFLVPLTSRLDKLLQGEFVLNDWQSEGLNVSTAVKRGIYTIQENLIIKTIGNLSLLDAQQLDNSLRNWLEI
ncbi:MazF family transcriptional regulator [Aphanothece hegewaldii CCALA 016]|uniref:MazF family transcriptional regulator n=1 Tax=Aphanothece hegewaldii CCALA 016 TaxID=2107694 RepID=A0A2T1LWU2_9CHRO|nr:type II toxin-antitoxin system PemK/MazF family toxin [Aphanothece hegewaldii]PSF36625.1 MazF family transcriptional regulator [Aphanothece hegewaldii CCALA 016]